ncbi:MAG TPA: protein-glutamine glutaminase family protein, partial [Bdellovibrionales bacterium]|nr:protein-glutamine glutaminase family protein [Bdellovibrionales bacterium]
SYLKYMQTARALAHPPVRSPGDVAEEYNKGLLARATVWESHDVLTERFNRMRDERFLTRPSRPDFQRRSSWLYPDDGCFARAQLANANLLDWGVAAPSKAFVFGDLSVSTPNSPSGAVSWWYHVVPVVEVQRENWVLDPAIDPGGPMRLYDWLAKQSPHPDDLEVAICASGAYTPYDDCDRVVRAAESMARADQGAYLEAEWRRLEQLGRDPERELGEHPPWR